MKFLMNSLIKMAISIGFIEAAFEESLETTFEF